MLRAVRFAAKLGFSIDPALQKAIGQDLLLLVSVPAARLFDEFLKLFQAGFAEKTFDLLREFKLFGELFPATAQELDEDAEFRDFVRAALRNTDRRVAQNLSVTPMFLLGVFLWAPAKRLAAMTREKEQMSEPQALSLAAYELSAQQQRRIALPRRFTIPMREMLALQPRFTQTTGKRAMKLLDHRRFRAAYDFMALLAEVGQFDRETADFWSKVQNQSPDERAESFQVRKSTQGDKRRRRRRRRRPNQATNS
jgi:poly(A) polymerase